MSRYNFLIAGLMALGSTFAQSGSDLPFPAADTVPAKPINLTTSSASKYINDLLDMDDLWRPSGDTMKLSLARLIDHYIEPFDSVESRLSGFHFDSIELRQMDVVQSDTLPLRWLNDSSFIIDTLALEKDPYFMQKTVIQKVMYIFDSIPGDQSPESDLFPDSLPEGQTSVTGFEDTLLKEQDTLLVKRDISMQVMDTVMVGEDISMQVIDTLIVEKDTLVEIRIDTAFLKSMGIQMYRIVNDRIIPPFESRERRKSGRFIPDSGRIIISDTLNAIVAESGSPFYMVPGVKMPDSLGHAVSTLLSYTYRRDSILLHFNDVQGQKTPFWLTSTEDDLYRLWVKNNRNDSITIWLGNPEKFEISMVLEEDLNVQRMEKEAVDDIPITTVKPDRSLAEVEPFEEIPVFWDYDFSSSFALNETYFSNWSKGGENSLSGTLDLNGTARYTNTGAETQWTNSARLNYGTIITEEHGLRTNTDIFELNSKYNKVIREKIDFSASFYMKNQIAKGYNYPNDSVVVSRFLNPGTFTIGLGVEYKPFKNTTLNFSPLSYKNTFVLDTASIDQTIHGIAEDKRAKQEMGGQLVIRNKTSILNNLNISNSVRLFSNYLNKPQNIDVDWEIKFEQKINWYFSVTLNLHMIYDDDVRFPKLDENDQPVLLPDGSVKKVPKMQFKQFLGLSFLFSF